MPPLALAVLLASVGLVGAVEHVSLVIVERVIAQRGTLGVRIKQTAISVRVCPPHNGEVGRCGLHILAIDVRAGRAPLRRHLQAGDATSLGQEAGFRTPGALTGYFIELH